MKKTTKQPAAIKQSVPIKQRMPLVTKQILSIITTALALLLLLMPVLTFQIETVEDDSTFLPFTSNLVFYGDEDETTAARTVNFLGLANDCFDLSKSAKESLNAVDEILDAVTEDPASAPNISNDERTQLNITRIWLTTMRVSGIIAGGLIYALFFATAGILVFSVVSVMIALFAKLSKDDLKEAVKMKPGGGAALLFGAYFCLLLVQFLVLGGMNYQVLSGGAGYGLKLVFVGGIQYLIAAIALLIITSIVNAVIDKCFPIEASKNNSAKAKKT